MVDKQKFIELVEKEFQEKSYLLGCDMLSNESRFDELLLEAGMDKEQEYRNPEIYKIIQEGAHDLLCEKNYIQISLDDNQIDIWVKGPNFKINQ